MPCQPVHLLNANLVNLIVALPYKQGGRGWEGRGGGEEGRGAWEEREGEEGERKEKDGGKGRRETSVE